VPSRLIREGILTSDRVDALDFASEVFYRRLMSKVDDHGLFDARTSVLRASLYPLRIDRVREADISRWIAMCEKAGLIALYQHDGKPYLRMLDTRWPARSDPKYPMPTEEGVANSCKQSPASAHLDVIVGGVVVVDKAHDRQADPFGEFWELYPKKVGKKPAREKWKAKKLDRDAESILADVRDRLKLDTRWKEGFIPNPATYLTQERWQDEWRSPSAVTPTAAGKPKGPSETPLERAVSYARQQFHYGQIDEAERDRLIAEATAKHRRAT
jgi:hypothetical protein